ncbi:MAG: membrane lipoprotein lipid attachment site-containing protein [Alphaproteobacteria bacterium]|nr:membrane lipoprotein lipid attachment site-containing protein [Alphaproteobacteria bacterium]
MRKIILMFLITVVLAGCSGTLFEAGKVSKERKELYDYNNNTEFCRKNPNRCVNNIPWM